MHGFDRFEHDDAGIVFRDLITLALCGFVVCVVLIMPHINRPGARTAAGTAPPGNVIVEARWPDAIDADVDLWVQAPGDVPVGYSNKGGAIFNLLRDDLESAWDVVLLSNILHHFSADDIRRILKRAYEALTANGTIAIWDLERPAPGKHPNEGDGIALFFRLTSTAAIYSGDEYAAWLRDAGFERITVVRPVLRPSTVLVHARR